MKYVSFAFVLMAILAQSLFAQSNKLAGDWEGQISAPRRTIIIKTHFEIKGNGYRGNIHLQGVKLPLEKIRTTQKDSVFFEFTTPTNVAKFKGHFSNDSTITGTYHQAGIVVPFTLNRGIKEKKKKPVLYHYKEIIIKNDSIKIAGTLTWPKEEDANQLVIMITGSGPENRDENIRGFKIFGQIADYLTMHGIATYRYDDPGVGGSSGELSEFTLELLASNVKAIIDHFSLKQNHHFKTIALLGHSQGGIVAGKVAAEDSLVDKIILMSSPSIVLYKVLNYQLANIFERMNLQSQQVKKTMKAFNKVLRSVKNEKNIARAKKRYHQQFAKMIKTLPDSARNRAKKMKILKKMGDVLIPQITTPIFMSVMFYNPANDLRKLDVPVLALFGGKDEKVLIGKNLSPMAAALDSAGVNYQINVFKNAAHLYKQQQHSYKDRYWFVEGFLPTVAQWLKRTVKN